MKIVFRADASLQIGTGHVMRCLTLADALAARGADCQFVCREHPGNLIEFIRSKGHVVHALPTAVQLAELAEQTTGSDKPGLAHGHWLGASQAQDAQACAPILAEFQPDWLIVDHYALDACWERALKPHYRKLMVIDDLADRAHACHVLLDQTFGRNAEDYRPWVPADCQLLCGSQYALLRPEFSALRPYSLRRRAKPRLRQLLITMGGVDKDNVTGKVLESLTRSRAQAPSFTAGSSEAFSANISAVSTTVPNSFAIRQSEPSTTISGDSPSHMGVREVGALLNESAQADAAGHGRPAEGIPTLEGGEDVNACALPDDCHITVVMGTTAPWLDEVRRQAQSLPWPTSVLVGVSNMAQLMADSDLAIGAAGATSWERCCLGLPTIMLVLADNQHQVAQGLELAGAVQVLKDPQEIPDRLPALLNGLLSSPSLQVEMCEAAARIADGLGVVTVIHHLEC